MLSPPRRARSEHCCYAFRQRWLALNEKCCIAMMHNHLAWVSRITACCTVDFCENVSRRLERHGGLADRPPDDKACRTRGDSCSRCHDTLLVAMVAASRADAGYDENEVGAARLADRFDLTS